MSMALTRFILNLSYLPMPQWKNKNYWEKHWINILSSNRKKKSKYKFDFNVLTNFIESNKYQMHTYTAGFADTDSK